MWNQANWGDSGRQELAAFRKPQIIPLDLSEIAYLQFLW